MLTKNIYFTSFKKKIKSKVIKKNFQNIIENKSAILQSLSKNYKYSYEKKILKIYKNFTNYRIIGIGGSILGTKTIYNFLNHKIKKNFSFIDNLQTNHRISKKKFVNLVVSKSGNTLETIINSNILIKKK